MSAFWVEGAYNLVKESLGGGAAVTLTTTGNFLGDIAEDASGVYLVENWNFEGQTGGFGVWKVAINGGPPATVASAGSMGPSFPSAQGIAVDATNIYWTDQGVDSPGAGRVMKVGRTGGKPTTLASGSGAPGEIAVDGTSAYWTNSNGLVMKIALVGGTSTTLASDQKSPGALAVDTANVYWVASGAIMKVALGGGSPTTLASGQDGPTRIAVDATSVYWTNAGSRTPQAGVTGTVMRLTPK
jgi:hypothetical protein